MAGEEKNLLPRIYHLNDVDNIVSLWRDLVDQFAIDEKTFGALFEEIFDPDTAPMIFIELMLKNLGNPFTNIHLTDLQKRKLVKLLIPIYRQKGTEVGVFNAIRLLTGITPDIIDPHGVKEDTWQVGLSEIGEATFSGGERVYCNLLNYTEDFFNAAWTKLQTVVAPANALGPQPWYRQADTVSFTNNGAFLQQKVTPLFMGDQNFTGSIFARANTNITVNALLQAGSDPTDFTLTSLNLTTDWQRFEFHHKVKANSQETQLTYAIVNPNAGLNQINLWGAHLIRNKELQPYAPSLGADGADCADTGRWAYHFLIICLDPLVGNQEAVIRSIADYMKPAHTHYTLIFPNNPNPQPDFFDHWELAISEVGINTYVH